MPEQSKGTEGILLLWPQLRNLLDVSRLGFIVHLLLLDLDLEVGINIEISEPRSSDKHVCDDSGSLIPIKDH